MSLETKIPQKYVESASEVRSGQNRNFKSSVSIKYLLSFTAFLGIIFVLILIAQNIIIQNNFFTAQKSKIERMGTMVADISRDPINNYDFFALDNFAREILKDVDIVDVLFLDPSGKRLNAKIKEQEPTAAREKFGAEKLKTAQISEYQFPIVSSDNAKIGTLVIQAHNLDLKKNYNTIRLVQVIIYIIGLVLIIPGTLLLFRRIIISPLHLVISKLEDFDAGNDFVELEVNSDDEIGRLIYSFNHLARRVSGFIDELNKKGQEAEEYAIKADQARLEAIKQAKELELSKKELFEQQGFLAESKSEAEEQSRLLSYNVEQILSEMEKFSRGDLTVRLHSESKGSIGKLFEGFNLTVGNISDVVYKLKKTTGDVDENTGKIKAFTEEIASAAQEQSLKVMEIADAIEEMTASIMKNSDSTTDAYQRARKATSKSEEGGNVMQSTVSGMNSIKEVISNSSAKIRQLGKSVNQIGQIIEVIDEIAGQTNLLALNAAIESARAGEHGRGFAIVAGEVRKLAERTSKATDEIIRMIKNIQDETKNVVESIEKGNEKVESTKLMVDKAEGTLSEIIGETRRVEEIITQLAVTGEEQAKSSSHINRNISGISKLLGDYATSTKEIALSTERLNMLTEDLTELVSTFRFKK